MLTLDRMMQIFLDFLDIELEAADPEYIRDALLEVMTKEEIEELDLDDWLFYSDY